MTVKVNPMIEIELGDIVTVRNARRICNELIEALSCMTVSEEADIICADDGEVLVTEKELYTMVAVFDTMDRIFEEAPYKNGDTSCGRKVLAVEFNN